MAASTGNKLVLSVSDEAVPLEIELRHPADKKTTATLQMFPKTLRPARSAFGYAGQQHFLSSEETGLFARLRKGAVRRAKVREAFMFCHTHVLVGSDSVDTNITRILKRTASQNLFV